MLRKQSLLRSHKLVRRKRLIFALTITAWFLACIFLVGLVAWLTSIEQLNINQILVSGNTAVTSEDLEAATFSTLSGNYYKLFSRANTFLYPKAAVIDTLQKQSPWIKKVSVKRNGLTALNVTVEERKPSAVWCGETRQESNNCFLMDDHGFVFAQAPDFKGGAYVKFYGSLSSTTPIASNYGSEVQFTHMMSFIQALLQLSLETSSVVINDTKEYSVYLTSGTKLMVTTNDTIEKIISNIQTLLSEEEFMKSQKQGFKNLEFIDLRFGNKIYYSFSDSN